jgi:glucokinase
LVVGIDLGGTRLKSGLVAGGVVTGGVTVEKVGGDDPAALLAGAAERLGAAAVGRVAIAMPGPFDYERGVGRSTTKLTALLGLDVGDALRERLCAPWLDVRFRNDAEAAGVAEATHGAGAPWPRALVITLGTGLGAALVVDGAPVAGSDDVVPGRFYRERVGSVTADDRFSARGLHALLGRSDLAAAAHDAASRSAFELFGRDLGRFLAPRLSVLDADVVVVAGGIAGSFELFGPALADAAGVPAVRGLLGDAAGVIGAAALFDPPRAS